MSKPTFAPPAGSKPPKSGKRIEGSLVWWGLGLVAAGFGAGFGFYKTLLEIQHRELPASEARHVESPLSQKYPLDNGLIADFRVGGAGPPRNALGETFSILSDSEWNGTSKCWYSLAETEGPTNRVANRFLRFFYQLEPRGINGAESYIGLFSDFSPPPSLEYDVSRFSGVTFRFRLEQEASPETIRFLVCLASANNPRKPGTYDFPSAEVEPLFIKNALGTWYTVKIPFVDFARPDFGDRPVTFDPKRVFRLVIALRASTDKPIHGHVDLDDIRFF